MQEIISERLIARTALHPDEINVISREVMDLFRRNFGGTAIYIQKKTVDYTERNAEIYKKSNGKNIRQLCRDYNLCAQQIRRIIQSGYQSEYQKYERSLFS